MARARTQDEVVAVLDRYRGKYLTVGVVMHELQDGEVYVTRETVRRWVLEYGCLMVDPSAGLYKVPEGRPRSHRKRAAGEAEPQPAAEVVEAGV